MLLHFLQLFDQKIKIRTANSSFGILTSYIHIANSFLEQRAGKASCTI